MTVGDGCFAHVRRDDRRPSAARYRVRLPPRRSSRGPRSDPGDAFLAGFVAARYPGRGAATASPRRRLRRGVHQHLGAGLVDPERVARLLAETEVPRMRASCRDLLTARLTNVNCGWVGR